MELTQAQIDDLRFRRRVVLPSFIAIIILSYLFFAFRFEIIVKRDYLDPNGQYGFLLDVNPEDVEIQRFLFRAALKNATIFPKSKNFKTTSDVIYFGYNPLNNFIRIYFGGNDIKIGDPETGIIVSSPNQVYNFRAILLDKDYDNFHFEFNASNINIFTQKDAKQLYSSDSAKIKSTCALGEEGFYRVEFITEIEKVDYSHNPKEYVDYIIKNLVPKFIKNQPGYSENIHHVEKLYELNGKLIGVTEPFYYKNNISAKIYKEAMDNIVDIVRGKLKPIKALQQFDINKNNFSFNIIENGKSDNSRFSSSLKLANDGNIVNAVIGFASSNEFSEKTRTSMAKLGLEYAKAQLIPLIKNYSVNGLEEIITNYMLAKRFSLNVNYIYNISTDTYTILTNNTINDFGLKMETKIKDKDLESYVILTSPSTLISGIKYAYDSGFRSLILENSKIDPEYLDKLVININRNGLAFLNSFTKNPNQKRENKITCDINLKLDPDNLDLKINDKNLEEIKEYKYVKKFMKNMPKFKMQQD
ncbi:MAG: hypothetical protein EKK61_05620 [Rickettsiales bacterium]|nr:MAG: hypothetical protein EKK61_05620 [Rickettsiales bacterium]